MPYCPKCNAVYNEGAAACPSCGQPLAAAATGALVQVYEAPNTAWAEAVKAALQKAGIAVSERLAQPGEVTAAGVPIALRLFVPDSRALDARWAVASFLSAQGAAPPGQTIQTAAPPTPMRPHNGTTVLVLGIISLVMCQFLGPVAWILGNNDLKEMAAGRMDPSGRDTTNAGRICGIIGTCLLGVSVLAVLAYLAIALAFFGSLFTHMH